MGGEGDFGWIVQDNFSRGQTGPCRTFANPPLLPPAERVFQVADLEIYGLQPLFYASSRSFLSSLRS